MSNLKWIVFSFNDLGKGIILQILFCNGNRPFADLSYGKEDSISPSTNFCHHREQSHNLHYTPFQSPSQPTSQHQPREPRKMKMHTLLDELNSF